MKVEKRLGGKDKTFLKGKGGKEKAFLKRKVKYFCSGSPLCLHEAGREVYLKQDKKEKKGKTLIGFKKQMEENF